MNQSESRMQRLRESMAIQSVEALLVLSEDNRKYLSGFTAEDHQFDETAGVLFITQDLQVIVTDSRFELQAKQEAPNWEVILYKQSFIKEIIMLAANHEISKIGYESNRMSAHQFHALNEEISKNNLTVVLAPQDDLVAHMREIKNDQEIDFTYQALRIAEMAFRKVIKKLAPGMTEKSIAWQLEMALRESGAEGLSFPTIIAAGPNSALPHAIPTDRQIKVGEPILIDWGCKLHGYCSDTTRTVILGPPDEQFFKVYHCVLEAQQRAIHAIKAGANSRAVDAVARDYINDQGFRDKFGHGLGHGTGLAVHEGPRLSPLRENPLEAGMIVTVEPGVYLPGWGGVRIEHQVVVRPDGAEVMNKLSTTYDISLL